MAGDDIVEAEWEEVPGNRGILHVARSKPREAAQPVSPAQADQAIDRLPWLSLDFWRSLPWGKAGLLIVALLVLAMILAPRDDENPAVSSETQPAVMPADGDPKQMLSDWALGVMGRPTTIGFTLIDGEGTGVQAPLEVGQVVSAPADAESGSRSSRFELVPRGDLRPVTRTSLGPASGE